MYVSADHGYDIHDVEFTFSKNKEELASNILKWLLHNTNSDYASESNLKKITSIIIDHFDTGNEIKLYKKYTFRGQGGQEEQGEEGKVYEEVISGMKSYNIYEGNTVREMFIPIDKLDLKFVTESNTITFHEDDIIIEEEGNGLKIAKVPSN